MAKETFDVKVVLSSEERILRVQSHQNEQENDTLFSVSSGSETLGVLHRGNNGWEWAEGARSPEEANDIGSEIDAHLEQ